MKLAHSRFDRPMGQRRALLRSLVTALLERERIETTLTKAKEAQSISEKMITLGKLDTLAARRQAMSYITKEDVVKKLFDTIAPRYAHRSGGYTYPDVAQKGWCAHGHSRANLAGEVGKTKWHKSPAS